MQTVPILEITLVWQLLRAQRDNNTLHNCLSHLTYLNVCFVFYAVSNSKP